MALPAVGATSLSSDRSKLLNKVGSVNQFAVVLVSIEILSLVVDNQVADEICESSKALAE